MRIVGARASLFAAAVLSVPGCSSLPKPGAAAHGATARCLHGHNDYLQPVPLRRAIELGLGSVEADVFLVDGELRVGHESWQLRAGRTLRALYLEPLRELVDVQPQAFAGQGTPFVLLVDIKRDGEAVYAALRAELESFRPMLTQFVAGTVRRGPVTVILSGDRPRDMVAADRERLCALDGRLGDLDGDAPPDLVPWISDHWSKVSDWSGSDELLPEERARIAGLVSQAHSQGRELRFWGAPDRAEAWLALRALGVDRIGTDRPRQAVAVLVDADIGG